MTTGSPDFYTPDAQLAASLDKLDEVLTDLDIVVTSLGEDLNSLTEEMKTLLTTLRSQAMGDSVSLHDSGSGTVGTSPTTILAPWTGRTGFSITNMSSSLLYLYIGNSTNYGMGMLEPYKTLVNETFCGAIRVKGSSDNTAYAFEEW